jgi:hypothetical protein
MRAQDSDLPHEVHLAFTSSEWDYRPASALSRRLEGATRRLAEGEVALVTHAAAAQSAADIWLQDLWVARERISFLLRPGFIGLEVGDVIRMPIAGTPRLFRILRIAEQGARKVEARAVDLSIFDHDIPRVKEASLLAPILPGAPHVEVLDLALAREDVPALQYVAAFADPWPGALSLYLRSGGGFDFFANVPRCAILGETLDVLSPGPVGRFDLANMFRVALRGGALGAQVALQRQRVLVVTRDAPLFGNVLSRHTHVDGVEGVVQRAHHHVDHLGIAHTCTPACAE